MENQQTQTPINNGKKNKGCFKIGIIVVIAFIAISVLISLLTPSSSDSESKSTNDSTKNVSDDQPKYAQVGQTLKTDYFEITVKNVELSTTVNTGNPYSSLKAEDGIRYIVIDVVFKNIDTESRMAIEGELQVNYNGKDYVFDKAETILAPGFGLLLEQINPLTSKKTKIVYKVPSELRGQIYWKPGRAGDDELFALGNIDK